MITYRKVKRQKTDLNIYCDYCKKCSLEKEYYQTKIKCICT